MRFCFTAFRLRPSVSQKTQTSKHHDDIHFFVVAWMAKTGHALISSRADIGSVLGLQTRFAQLGREQRAKESRNSAQSLRTPQTSSRRSETEKG